MKKQVKVIFHIDMNAFYASCAIIKEPYLKNRVFAISGASLRGVLLTASYKARKYGIHAGMSVSDAQRLYPKLLLVPTDFNLYKEKSTLFIDVLSEYTDIIQQASIDEAYLDVTVNNFNLHPIELAKEIMKRLLEEHNLPCSIGIAPTLFLAKMASDIKKPLGITILRKRDVEKILYPMDVSEIHGIGKKTYPRLKYLGINTIRDFMNLDNLDIITKVIKENSYYEHRNEILGNGSNKIDPDKYKYPKSISSETTFNYDAFDRDLILEEIENQLNDCITRLNRYNMLTKTIGYKLKKTDFTTMTRSITIDNYTNDPVIIKDTLDTLFYDTYENEEVRLVGASLSNLILKKDKKEKYNLFNYQKFIDSL